MHTDPPLPTRDVLFASISKFTRRHVVKFVKRKQLLGIDPDIITTDVVIGILKAETSPDPATPSGRKYLEVAAENCIWSSKRNDDCLKRGGCVRTVKEWDDFADSFVGKRERARRGANTRPECEDVDLAMDLAALVAKAKPEHHQPILNSRLLGVKQAAIDAGIARRTLADAISRLKSDGFAMEINYYMSTPPLRAQIASVTRGEP